MTSATTDTSDDLIVVGAGLCGLTAALVARQGGPGVLVVEKTATIHGYGNSVVSGGMPHAAGLDPFTASDAKARVLDEATDGTASAHMARTWASTSAEATRCAMDNGAESCDGYGSWPSVLAPR